MEPHSPHPGCLIRSWRQRRQLSQLEVALRAEVSTRHLCFVETGRSSPSRKLVLKLARVLDIPMREQNELLLSAGFAPIFAERTLDAPEMRAVQAALQLVLRGHEPYPAFVVDRHYNMISMNRSVSMLLSGVAPHLLDPLNVIRVCLHPDGLAHNLLNYESVRFRLLARLWRDVEQTGDAGSIQLFKELESYPAPDSADSEFEEPTGIATSLRLRTDHGEMAFLTTVATFSNPTEVTVDELSIESFFPADDRTAALIGKHHAHSGDESSQSRTSTPECAVERVVLRVR